MNDFSSVNIFKRSFNFLIGCSKPDGASSITYWGSQENWWFRTAYVDGCIKINSCPEDFVFKFFNAMSWGRNWKFLSQTFTICLGISKGHRVGSDFSFTGSGLKFWRCQMIWFIWYDLYDINSISSGFLPSNSPMSYLGIHSCTTLWQRWHLFFCTPAVSRIALLWTLSFLRRKSLL